MGPSEADLGMTSGGEVSVGNNNNNKEEVGSGVGREMSETRRESERGASGGGRTETSRGGGEAQPGRGRRLLQSRRLHVKACGKADLGAAMALASGQETRSVLQKERRWLEEVGSYYGAGLRRRTANGCPQHNMRPGDVDLMVAAGVVEETTREEVRGHVQMFLHDEPAKERYRPIRNTRDFNAVTTRDICGKTAMATKKEVVAAVHDGDYMLQLDFAAYYDQIVLAPAVRALHCFRDGARYYRLKTLPMGSRIAVGVAGALTALLLDFGPLSRVLSIIDNVVFIGKREEVVRDAAIFVERCKSVGLTLNEDTTDLDALVQQRGVWGGVHIDLVSKEVMLSEKSHAKTTFSWANKEQWTWRRFACHIGLLWWAVGIVDVRMHEYFEVLRFVSHVSRMLTDDDERWEQQAQVWPSVWPALQRWTEVLLRNEPRKVPPPSAAGPTWVMATDACRYGWGVVATNLDDGRSWCYGARWYADFVARHGEEKMRRSTFTECHAIVAAACKLLRQQQQKAVVLVMTDSTTAVSTYNRGYNSRSYDLNECAARLAQLMPQHDFVFKHIAGASNPADWWSRNPGAFASEEKRAEAVRGLRR